MTNTESYPGQSQNTATMRRRHHHSHEEHAGQRRSNAPPLVAQQQLGDIDSSQKEPQPRTAQRTTRTTN
eukprot:10325557-Prorocentrum_lima.AAC.1